MADGSPMVFATRPIALTLIAAGLAPQPPEEDSSGPSLGVHAQVHQPETICRATKWLTAPPETAKFPNWEPGIPKREPADAGKRLEILGRKILEDFARDHADSRVSVDAWSVEVEAADWNGPDDIRKRYASASFMADNRVVFDLRGNRYRLDVKIAYRTKRVLVVRIGTHAEYDRWTF